MQKEIKEIVDFLETYFIMLYEGDAETMEISHTLSQRKYSETIVFPHFPSLSCCAWIGNKSIQVTISVDVAKDDIYG